MTTRQIAHGIAQLGRNGDSTLVHMQPHEVAGLQALAKANGTSLTVNPHTGLPEAFSLGGFFSSLLPVFAGAATGGAGMPLWAGIAAGAATGAATSKDPLTGALMGGMGGYGGFNLGQGLANMGAMNAAANPEGFANAAAINASNAAGPTAVGNSIADGAAILNQGVNPAITQGITQAGGNVADPLTQDFMKSASENLARSGQNLKDVVTMQPGAWDSFKQGLAGLDKAPLTDLQAAGKIAMPLGGAVLSGLEPTDIYGQPIKYDTSGQKYDPYRTLNLNTNTGLRLYAAGGPVSFADGGDSNKELSLDPAGLPGGGAAALQGADQVEVTPGGTKLGIFATADQIDAARKADELAKAAQGRGLPGLGIMTGLDRGTVGLTNMGRMSGMGSTAPTMISIATRNTAPTAQTAAPKYNYLEQLNLNKQYATGGTIQSGGMQDLYNTNDDTTAGVALSRDGYGLGRLNAMAQGGVPSYADGGDVEKSREIARIVFGTPIPHTGVSLADGMSRFVPDIYSALGIERTSPALLGGGSGAMQGGGSDALRGGNLNLNSRTGLARGGYLDVPSYADGGDIDYSKKSVNLNEVSGLKDNTPVAKYASGFNPNASLRDALRSGGINPNEYFSALSINFGDRFNQAPDAYYNTMMERTNRAFPTTQLARGGYLDGPGDGMSDSIPATIEGRQPARLADGEFVVPADVVSHLGNGSTKAGSERLYGMLDKVRKARTGTTKQGKKINPNKFLPA